MTKKTEIVRAGSRDVEIETSSVRRPHRRPKVSSGENGRDLADVLQHFETAAPATAKRTGMTSAGMRAGAIVRGMRRSAGFTQARLAQKLGITQERVSEIELGHGPQGPTYELLERIAAACGMVIMPIERGQLAALEHSAAMALRDEV